MKSLHRGEYWIGTYEVNGDKPKGTLTSASFKVTLPYASFLVGGGPMIDERVELVRADNNTVIFKTTGHESEAMRPVTVDLHGYLGQEIFIRLIDNRSDGWCHLNFDDFKLY